MEGSPTSGSSAQPGTPLANSAERRATSALSAQQRGKQAADISTADQEGQDLAYLRTLGSHPSTCQCLLILINGKVADLKVDTHIGLNPA